MPSAFNTPNSNRSSHDFVLSLAHEWSYLLSHWEVEKVREFAQQLDALIEQPAPHLSELAANLAAYLAAFADGAMVPTRGQLSHLNTLANLLFATTPQAFSQITTEVIALVPTQRRTTEARNTICFLDIRDTMVPGLTDSLIEKAYRLRHFSDLESLENYLDHTKPGVLILDAARLRSLPRLAGKLGESTPGTLLGPALIIVSEGRDLTHRLLAMRAGAIAFFGAPLDSYRIVSRIEQLLGNHDATPCRVLIVDGERAHATQCGRWLVEQGMTARLAFDAQSATRALEEFRPDILLIDSDLPDARGFELAQLIRQQTEYATVPIVLYAQSTNEAQRFDAIAAGADEFLLKPLKARHLQAVISSRVRRAQWIQGPHTPQAYKDPRTGLHHRQYSIEKLNNKIPPLGSALLFVLFDRAEQVRESIGLEGLPKLEIEVAQALREACSQADVISPLRDFAYIVIVQREHRDQISDVAERIKYRLHEKRIDSGGNAMPISVSVGMTLLDDGGDSVDARVARAEAAALAATRVGGHRVLWYEPNEYALIRPDPKLAVRAVLSRPWNDLNHRLDFRPIVALSGKLTGQFDMLYSLVSTQEPDAHADYEIYAPVAADIEALHTLEIRRLQKALETRESRLRQGRQIRLFFPILGRSILNEPLIDWLLDELKSRKLSGTGLTLELPSNDFLDHRLALAQPLNRLRQSGIRIGLTDYGRDWAAVHVLSTLPVDFLRLDAELVQHTSSDKALNNTLLALVRKAHMLGASVIAPHVESIDHAHVLLRLGIDYGVGNGLGKPVREPEFDFNRPLW
jgi:PleD family two-component response regulator/EAL domain-containing protein (putative c-di-GMP-specific phosphodiesterase class I)